MNYNYTSGIAYGLDDMREIIQVPVMDNGSHPQLLSSERDDGSILYLSFIGYTLREGRLKFQEITEKIFNIILKEHNEQSTEPTED